ncbi:MAG: putative sugar nucleotidyl transferase [Spirosomaceae bacterium]|nr:putative sugar nucleotidyl transferase [Spirosomataceae bacterium]
MNLFDDPILRNQLKPLTLTRPVGKLRIGIQTIVEKWAYFYNDEIGFLTEEYLQKKFKVISNSDLYVNASVLPNEEIWQAINALTEGEALTKNGDFIAVRTSQNLSLNFEYQQFTQKEYPENISIIKKLPDLFLQNAEQITADFKRITKGRESQEIKDPFTRVYSPENVFLEDGADVKAAIINAENGPVYIGKNAVLQEGCLVIGPAAIGENSMVAFGAKIRPNVTLGPVSRVGGEVGNSIFMGYSNKAHDGFLGNSVIGEWCNLGANTNNSNLKNDYKEVTLYDYNLGELAPTGEIFCGTFMGDYTKAGISTMFNTGTVIGVCSNVFGGDFQEKFIPSFTWGGKMAGYENYRFDKAIDVIIATMSRRNLSLSEEDIEILRWVNVQKSVKKLT